MAHLPIWMLGSIPTDVCDAAAREFDELPKQDANMGVSAEVNDHAQRNTSIAFAKADHWFGGILFEFGLGANNQMGWDYALGGHESVQWAEYGASQHYDWHIDTFPLVIAPVERKVSVICLMSDPSEFEGGDFQVRLYQDYTAPLQKGTVIAFPSMLQHRVTPILNGTRRSATMWITGPRMR